MRTKDWKFTRILGEKTILAYSALGGILGYLVLSPISMIIADIKHDRFYGIEQSILNVLTVDYLYWAVFYILVGVCVGLIFGLIARERLIVYKRISESEEQLNQVRKILIAMFSHEIRTPLTSLIGSTNLLLEDRNNLSPSKSEEILKIIQRSGQTISTLVDNLAEFSLLETGQFNVDLENEIDFSKIVRYSIDEIRLQVDKKEQVLKTQIPDTPILLMGDRERLTQAVRNLLSNAVKFTSNRGMIRIYLKPSQTIVQLIISDTGIGFSSDEQSLLFQKFERASSASKIKGTGLGLSIVEEIVKAHNGTVSASSEGPEKGATFTIELPLLSSKVNSLAE